MRTAALTTRCNSSTAEVPISSWGISMASWVKPWMALTGARKSWASV